MKIAFWPPVIKYASLSDMNSSVTVLGFFLIHALESTAADTVTAAILYNLNHAFYEKSPFFLPCVWLWLWFWVVLLFFNFF